MAQALLIVAWASMLERLIRDIGAASDALDEATAARAPQAWLIGPSRRRTTA